ncbi:MAG: ABC transporter substrate-binding protein, partial [Pseudomonadota bacterium]
MRRTTHLLATAAAVAMLAGPTLAERGGDGQLNIIYWQAPSTLNPYLSGGTKEVESASMILEPLAGYDQNGNLYPRLVEEIPTVANGGVAEDLKSITWKLKPGILWSDGTPLTSADAVFTWEYCTNEQMGCAQSSYFDGVSAVEAVDDLTIKITFDDPKPYPYTALVGSESPVIQKAQFEECTGARAPQCTDQNFGPIGTRPVVVTDFKPKD